MAIERRCETINRGRMFPIESFTLFRLSDPDAPDVYGIEFVIMTGRNGERITNTPVLMPRESLAALKLSIESLLAEFPEKTQPKGEPNGN